jgi:hypothetical protein
MPAGLFYVYTEPAPGLAEAEFHDWYDNLHGPARLAVPGFRTGYRYQAADDLAPPWLALYDLDSPDVVSTPAYRELVSKGAGPGDTEMMARLSEHGTLDRRLYEQVSSDGDASTGAPVILAVGISVPPGTEDDMTAWYTHEHIPMLLAVPGWRRIRRFRLINGDAPDYLSLHELSTPAVFEEDGYRAAISTPWRDRIVATALRRERRTFSFRNSFG